MVQWVVELANAWAAAFTARDAAKLFGNWLTILGLSSCLTIWAIYAGWRLQRGTHQFRRASLSALTKLQDTPAAAQLFVASYERVRGELSEDTIIGPSWRDWVATLITPTVPGLPVRSTVRPSEFISLELLRNCGINPRLHTAVPNLLVGVGLMLTFLGLSLALSAAGGIVGADKAMREIGLKDLLAHPIHDDWVFTEAG